MTELVDQLERTAFHDGTFGRRFSDGNSIHLQFRNIMLDLEKEEYYSALVILTDVREVGHGGVCVGGFRPESDSAGVLEFYRDSGTASLLPEWQFFRPNATVLGKYNVDFGTSEISAERLDDLIV